MKKIKLWHKTGLMPAFNEVEAFFDGESEIPMEEVKREDSIEEGQFFTDSELAERDQMIWDAAIKKALEARKVDLPHYNERLEGFLQTQLNDFLKAKGWEK